jgi:plasmid stabilization system protein ParE
MGRTTVRVTRHFARNLESIEEFLHEADAAAAFAALLEDLFDQAIPALEDFPDLGRDFFTRPPSCREGAALAAKLRRRLGRETSLHELVRGEYLILYARRGENLYLLAIKHYRQLSFDFPEHWEG